MSKPQPAPAPENRRERVVWLYQKAPKIQPRTVHGWFAGWRWALVWATQLVFYGVPWLTWNGRQAVLFDLEARRFFIFELVLYPQDFIYLTGLLIVSAYALFLFTAVAGRLWCGYACPQTVYTEIFLWIERRFEGDRMQRIKRDAAPTSTKKLLRKAGKHAAWGAVALWTGFSFVGYFTPIRELLGAVAGATLGPWQSFWIGFYSLATYGNAGWLREQVCLYMCPYARFQSAMFDKDTLIIGYDSGRGEPRGAQKKKGAAATAATQPPGDCIDCGLCVQVCPTGIDIRNGLQYACIGCAACIDVCNGVMDKMRTPRGLIRYDTQRGLAQNLPRASRWERVLRPRVLVYAGVLLAIMAALAWSLVSRPAFRVDVVRDRGVLARTVADGWVENVYRFQLMNTTEAPQQYRVGVNGLEGAIVEWRGPAETGPAEARWVPLAVRVPPQTAAALGTGAHPIHFQVDRPPGTVTAGQRLDPGLIEKSTFIVPR
jgi:cytochrome c oxidase accessory protein FixG